MNTDVIWSAVIGTTPGFIGSLVMFYLTRKSNKSLEKVKTDLQRDVIQFTKWHEKRVEALITIYTAFCDYLVFLRQALYFERSEGMSLDPMHAFGNTIERQMLYLDDSMARKISQYQGELLSFRNTAITDLSSGESARERIQHQLDFEIPAYLPRLQEDINRFLDPNSKGDDKTYRRLIDEWLSSQTRQRALQGKAGVPESDFP
jgi:hypothetical protein